MSDLDRYFMQRAIAVARDGRLFTRPNPSVGCVIVSGDKIIAEGATEHAGGRHAERVALEKAGNSARGATVYVTLEPCSHHGRTGPCADALIDAGVGRVVFGSEDPYHEVSGRGLGKLRDAGIDVFGPVEEALCRESHRGFFSRVERHRPFVVMKSAISLDGRTAMASGESKWITGVESRRDVQVLRARSGAILSGIESIISDDSRLSLRQDDWPLTPALYDAAVEVPPVRVILDSNARLHPSSRVASDGIAPTWWITCDDVDRTLADVKHFRLPRVNGRLCLRQVLGLLAENNINDLLVETGATLGGAFLSQDLIDEWIVYIAPKVMGSSARPLVNLPFSAMSEARELRIKEITAMGDDVRLCLSSKMGR